MTIADHSGHSVTLMSDVFPPRPLPRDPLAKLLAAVPKPDFADQLMAYIRQAADIANFGTFYVADMARPKPVLSIWGGEMSGYWFNRNASKILSNERLISSILTRIRAAPMNELSMERWRPAADDPISPIYARDAVIERVTVSSRSGRSGFQSFFLRGKSAGWLAADEMDRLQHLLPMVHELIGLRHRIVGATAFHPAATARVTALRDRDVALFSTLSAREAEVCDLALQGLSVAGTALELQVSENTVRTLRRRAYSKLGVNSATQIAAVILSNMQ